MYPHGTDKADQYYQLGNLETTLEGHFRPGHFQGVCRVVHRLLEIIHPDLMILGQKDYQQCMVIRRLLEITGLPSRLIIAETIREEDGLAMSSRNRRLSADARKQAAAMSRVLRNMRNQLTIGKLDSLKREAVTELTAEGYRVEYVEIAEASTLEPCNEWDGKQKIVALAAAFLDGVRLIDNLPLT
jgi:pantoate--beta-alanine ligase